MKTIICLFNLCSYRRERPVFTSQRFVPVENCSLYYPKLLADTAYDGASGGTSQEGIYFIQVTSFLRK